MQLHILDDEGTVIGGCSLENTLWRMTEDGLVNESFLKITWDSHAEPTRGRISNSNGTVSKEAEFRLNRGEVSLSATLGLPILGMSFSPGQFTITDVFWRPARDDGGESAESKESGVEVNDGETWL